MGTTFYMSYSRSRPNSIVPWVEDHDVPLLTNATHRWSDRTGQFLDMYSYDTKHVIDAGGYNVQSSYGGRVNRVDGSPVYPWSVEEYHEWLQHNSDEIFWATVMDYACEERFDDMWSVDDRITATIENTVEHLSHDPSYDVLPVLQGRTVDDYVECAERLQNRGVDISAVGLGTVCRLSSSEEILSVESAVRENTDVETLHGFGVKVDSYSRGATFDSADSHAWVYAPSRGKILCLEREDGDLAMRTWWLQDDSKTRTVHSFKVYYAYVTWLIDGRPAVDVSDIIDNQKDIPHETEQR